MKIMISGSMAFASRMLSVKKQLEEMGHTVFVPHDTQTHVDNPSLVDDLDTNLAHVREQDVMRKCFSLVADSDAVLILNLERNNMAGYIGVSTLMEAGLAFFLKKKLFVMYPIPNHKVARWAHEITLLDPVLLNGDLTKIS